jgi:hypothetical protein
MIPGLWHEVILKKYLKKKYVVEWFREGRKNLKGISNCWRALTTSLPIITDWLVWKLGNGWDIRLGVDPLIGAQSFYKLSVNLVNTFHSKGIKFLAQVASLDVGVLNVFNWKSAEMLGLSGEQKEEWEIYVKGLKLSGFVLTVETDSLVWSWDNKGGKVTAK